MCRRFRSISGQAEYLNTPRRVESGAKGSRPFLRILSTEGRGVRLCRAISKPKGPKDLRTKLKAQGPSRTCNESKEEEEEGPKGGWLTT